MLSRQSTSVIRSQPRTTVQPPHAVPRGQPLQSLVVVVSGGASRLRCGDAPMRCMCHPPTFRRASSTGRVPQRVSCLCGLRSKTHGVSWLSQQCFNRCMSLCLSVHRHLDACPQHQYCVAVTEGGGGEVDTLRGRPGGGGGHWSDSVMFTGTESLTITALVQLHWC